MSPWVLFALVVFGPPTLYSLLLLACTGARRRADRVSRTRLQTVSVAALAARIEQERAGERHEVRWPRADPDRGIMRDDRPTRDLLPLRPRRPAPPSSALPHG